MTNNKPIIPKSKDFTKGWLVGSILGATLTVLYLHAWRKSLLEDEPLREPQS